MKNLNSKSFIKAAKILFNKDICWVHCISGDEFDFYEYYFNNDGIFFEEDNESRILALLFCAAMVSK